ncbi:hypothetical protein GH714_032192 [Hevea brasiliensis]|uniref:EGF-like domain-containing protein n=1 Tax=Hevea brasiliensis TaxID=3981 RepID=A0A6A6LDK6_HEVBR|nr:hypothetical protein GH714_032192 [Hevea brasiliensis]
MLGNLQRLTVIDLSSNMLNGRVPMSLGSQQFLISLHLQNNNLQGQIPISLRNLEYLETLDLSMNAFNGFMPSWIGESLSSLKVLSVHSNKFQGKIPQQLCYLASLRILNLANNMMTGTIPTCFGNFTAIAMPENKGLWDYYPRVPFEEDGYSENVLVYVKGIEREYTSTLRFLYSIDLSGNKFAGNIPKELMTLSEDELPKGDEKVGNTRKHDFEMLWFYSGLGMGFVPDLLEFVAFCILKTHGGFKVARDCSRDCSRC